MKQLFVYNAKLKKVIDGDTIDFTVDLGFNAFQAIRTRLMGINTPELSEETGKDAKLFVISYLPIGKNVVIETYKYPSDKYGRWLAVVYIDGWNLNQMLLANGLATEYVL